MSNKRNKMFNLEFFQCLKTQGFQSWAQFLWAGGAHGLGFTWAHPWALTRVLGPVTSLGSSLDDRHLSLGFWAAGQGSWPLTWLESTGEGWGRLDKASGPEQAWICWQNTLAHTEHSGTLLDRNFVG